MWDGYRRAEFTCYCCGKKVLIGASQDYNNHFHFLSLFHESVRINSVALYKIRIAQGDGIPSYLYIIFIPSELHGHIEILV